MVTQIISMVLPVLVMIVLGRVCARTGVLNDERHAGLKALIGDVLLPVVLFQAFFTAEYSGKLLLVFVLVFAGCLLALAAGYLLRRFVAPYGRFMPLLMTSFEGGMLGYSLYALLAGAGYRADEDYNDTRKLVVENPDGTLEGVVADAVKAQMSMNMKLDLEELMADLSALAAAGTSEEPAAPTAEEQALLTALKEKGVGLEMRMDMDKGMLYMTFTGEALEALGLPAGTWYSMDMGALFEQLGMDYAELMDLSKTLDASVMLEAMLQSADLSYPGRRRHDPVLHPEHQERQGGGLRHGHQDDHGHRRRDWRDH